MEIKKTQVVVGLYTNGDFDLAGVVGIYTNGDFDLAGVVGVCEKILSASQLQPFSMHIDQQAGGGLNGLLGYEQREE
ncbi:hypothetical protein ACLOJK_019414 [Asimina triloba]